MVGGSTQSTPSAAIRGFAAGTLAGILVLRLRDGRIQAVQVIGDPRQLALVSSRLG